MTSRGFTSAAVRASLRTRFLIDCFAVILHISIRSLIRLWSVDPGFNPRNVLTVGLTLPQPMMTASPDAVRAALREFDRKIASIPGVEAVSQTWGAIPMAGDDEQTFWFEGQPKPASENEMNWAIDYIVEPGYLKAMEIPLLRGRFFTDQDNEHSPRVIVVDDVFAHKFFPNQDPIRKRIKSGNFSDPAQIVGVVLFLLPGLALLGTLLQPRTLRWLRQPRARDESTSRYFQ